MKERKVKERKKPHKAAVTAVLIILVIAAAAVVINLSENSGSTISETEKERIESQPGVKVTGENEIEVDLEEITKIEDEQEIKKEEAQKKVTDELGEGSQIKTTELKKNEDKYYWIIYAQTKGGDLYQIWVDAQKGEIFLKQKESEL